MDNNKNQIQNGLDTHSLVSRLPDKVGGSSVRSLQDNSTKNNEANVSRVGFSPDSSSTGDASSGYLHGVDGGSGNAAGEHVSQVIFATMKIFRIYSAIF